MAVTLPSVYQDGTATVAANGTVVTGQSTLWTKAIIPGDFFGVHKGYSVRILSVDSDTQVTLANPWPGAAQTAAHYEIMLCPDTSRMQETSRQLLQQLSNGNIAAFSGLAGAPDTLPYFTGSGTMALTGLTATGRDIIDSANVSSAQAALSVDNKIVYAVKSGIYTAVAADNNGLLRFTAAATLSLAAVATLGANWHVMVIADGGDVIVDPNGAETINGASTLTIKSGQSALIISNGAAFYGRIFGVPISSEALRGSLNGLTLSNNVGDATNDIDIAAGNAASDGAIPSLMTLGAGITKRLDAAWAFGTNQGGLDTGALTDGTYHVFLIQRSDTGLVDALLSLSPTSPAMPANYDRKRRIGSIRRVSGAITPFYQNGDYFYLQTPILDVSANNPGTTAILRTLSVPFGIVTKAIIGVNPNNGTAAFLFRTYISSPNVPDVAAASINESVEPAATVAGRSTDTRAIIEIDTNTSSQVRSRHNASDAGCFLNITTFGWIDNRGRLQ